MVFHSPLNFDSSSTIPPARELARRRSGTDEIELLWHPEDNRVEVSVRDVTTDATFYIEVAPGSAAVRSRRFSDRFWLRNVLRSARSR